MTLVCDSGHPGQEGDRWCTTCGVALARRCASGHVSGPEDRFCTTCGAPLDGPGVAGTVGVPASLPVTESVGPPTECAHTAWAGLAPLPPEGSPERGPDVKPASTSWTVAPPEGTGVSVPVPNWDPGTPWASRPPRGGVLAPLAASIAAVLLLLDVTLPPAFPVYFGGHPLWTFSLAHVGYYALSHIQGSDVVNPTRPTIWIILADCAALATAAMALIGLSTRGRRTGVAVAVGGSIAAVSGVLGAEIGRYHLGMGIGCTGALVSGLVCVIAGAAMALGGLQPRPAMRPLSFTAIIGSVLALVAGIGFTSHHTPVPVAFSPPDTVYTPSTEVPSTEVPSTPAGSLSNVYDFTATASGGYTFSGTLSIGAPQHLVSGLQEGSLTAGSACSINSENDAVIPADFQMDNTTANFSSYVGARLQWSTSAISGIEVGYTDGAQCETNGVGTNSTNPEPQGFGFNVDMFIVVPSYYNPDHPDGNEALLSGATLQLVEDSSSSEGWDITPQSVSGPGSSSDGGLFIPIDPNAPGANGQSFQITQDGSAVMSDPSLGASQIGTLSQGTNVTVVCTTQGDAVQGDTLWDKISSPDDGYVADQYVNTNNGQGIPSC